MPETLRGKYQNFTEAEMDWLEETGCPVRFTGLEEGVRDYVHGYLAKTDSYL
jgi:ADP-L-glycero-D-manno-heptose 6-epimerase